MDPLGWLRASGNLLQMRMKNPSRFKEILVEADIYGRPEAAKISFAGRIATFGHAGAQVALEACEINIIEIFFEESYKQFNANGKRVIDVGCAGGDTAIYFLLHGASSVTGYDISPEQVSLACRNADRNAMGGRAKFECREVLSLKELQGDVLKMDIEGGEHKIFAQANDGDITKFGEIILEYHGGAGNLKARLENLSFEVALFHPTFNGRNGILHARKKTPPNRP